MGRTPRSTIVPSVPADAATPPPAPDLSRFVGQVHAGDCLEGLARLPAGSVDLAFADPPFNIGYDYDVYDDSREHQAYLNWSRQWIAAVHRVLKSTGTFWLAIGDEYAAELKLLSEEIGFHTRSWVVWYYTFGVNCKYKFTRSHAHLFYFVKDPKSFTYLSDDPANRIPSARQLVYADNRANPKGRLPDDTWILRPQDLAECFTAEEDTWYFPRVAGTFKERAGFHGCQMPEQLLGRIIRACSHEGDTVLDPFSGSATTLVVARKLGRRPIGFELSPEYVARGQARLDSVCQGDALDGAAEPTMSAPSTPTDPKQKKGKLAKAAEADKQAALAMAARDRTAELTARGLIEAFRKVADGHSLDRLLVDPDLSEALAAECRRLGLAGDSRSWNLLLFRLRKAGKLADVPTTKWSETSWADCDPYLFASEIAWRQMLDEGAVSLDDILSDPALARRFDSLAAALAPGFTPREYRQAALKLRKEARNARTRADQFAGVRLGPALPVDQLATASVPNDAGVYLVTDSRHRPLYAGEALSLQTRLRLQFDARTLPVWQRLAPDLHVALFETEPRPAVLMAYQSQLVGKHRPQWNLPELAAL